MGYYIRSGTQITDFWPDDTEDTLYIGSSGWDSLADLFRQAQNKWGKDVKLEDINVTSEKIHTHCIYYDRYDAGDYTEFIVLKYERPKLEIA